MKRKFLGSLAVVSLILATGCGVGSDRSKKDSAEEQLNQAIKNLSSPSKISRRRAVEKISSLTQAPGIENAILPLADVLLDRGAPSGVFTQQIAATDLGKIASYKKGRAAGLAIEALSESLKTEGFDMVRAACADALGLANSELAVAPLQESLAKDPSPLVKYVANKALQRLAQSGIQAPVTGNLSSSQNSPSPVPSDTVVREYLLRHIIYSHAPIGKGEGR